MSFHGKVAVVIGASRGSGKRIALELAEEGADIVVAARTERPDQSDVSGTIHQTAKEIEALGRRALAVKVDLAIGADIDALFERTLEAFGRIDVLVYSVQYMGPGYLEKLEDTTVDQLDLQLKVNLLGAMHATKLAAKIMEKQGGGRILLITSLAAWGENVNMPGEGSTGLGYPVSKAGMNRFVLAAAKELKPKNVSIVAVDPGFTLAEHVTEGAKDGLYHAWDIRFAHGVEVPAKTVRYLATCPDPMWYTGKVVVSEEFVREHNLLRADTGPDYAAFRSAQGLHGTA